MIHGECIVSNVELKFKTSMLKSGLCDYSDAYILVKGTITVPNTAATGTPPDNRNKKVILENCAPFTDSISEISNAETYHAKDADAVMRMHNLIEYSDNYSQKFGNIWQYYRDEPALNNNSIIFDFPDDNYSTSLEV